VAPYANILAMDPHLQEINRAVARAVSIFDGATRLVSIAQRNWVRVS